MNEFPKLDLREYVLVYPPARAYLAEGLAALAPERFFLNPVKCSYFNDGEPNFVIPNLWRFTSQNVIYIADWLTPVSRYYDLCCLIPISELGCKSVTVIVPFFPTATMEREVFEGSVATANVDAKLLSHLNGQIHILTVDLHTMQNQFFFHGCVVSLKTSMQFAREKLLSGEHGHETVVAFPDDGAHKRFYSCFSGFDVAICAKVRDGDKRRVTLNDGDVDGKRVLIVDDLVRSGGTLIECAKVLLARGATSIDIFVPHACFPKGEYVRFIDGEAKDLIGKFYVTDSVYKSIEKIKATGTDKFTVLPLAEIIVHFGY